MDSENTSDKSKVESSSEIATVSPLLETVTGDTPVKGGVITVAYTRTPYTYVLSIIIIGLVVYLLYYSYTCFYDNQDLINEPFIEKTIKTGIDDDHVFDVDGEVNKLRQLQEKYLNSLNSKRNR
jgi:hypothetical protein